MDLSSEEQKQFDQLVAMLAKRGFGEAILQLRAAVLCDDERLERFLATRPGHPFHPNASHIPSMATAG